MKFQPIVSIIVPVYNAEKYLHECIKSILSQTLKEFELILVDDGSTDSSGDICDAYANKDNRIVVIHTPNQKSLLARKTGVEIAKGKYTYFVDADDYLGDADALIEMVGLIESSGKNIIQFSIGVNAVQNPSAEIGFKSWHEVRPREIECAKEILEACFIENNHSWVLWNKLFKTEICKKAFSHIEDVKMKTAEDAYIYFLIVYFSETYESFRTKPLYIYRVGSGISSKKEINLGEFEEYCKEVYLLDLLGNFLKSEKISAMNYSKVLLELKRRIFLNALNRYKQLNIFLNDEGFLLLKKYYLNKSFSGIVCENKLFDSGKYIKYKILNLLMLGGKKYQRKMYIQTLFKEICKL